MVMIHESFIFKRSVMITKISSIINLVWLCFNVRIKVRRIYILRLGSTNIFGVWKYENKLFRVVIVLDRSTRYCW